MADAYNNMAKIYHKMGRASDAYPMLQRFIELSDTIRKCRHTEEAIALQELYKHEQLSVENLYWRTRAAERQRNVYWMTTISLLLVWVASAVYFIYRRNRNRLMAQQHQLVQQEKELKQQRKATSESLRRMVEMEQKEARLKETFFRRLSQKVVQELEKGGAMSSFQMKTGMTLCRMLILSSTTLRNACSRLIQVSIKTTCVTAAW